MTFSYRLMALLTIFAASGFSTASAGIILDISNVTVAPGGTGFLDVFATSDSVTGDSFQYFTLDFTVTGAAQTAKPMDFLESAIPAPQLTATNPDYVFLGNSFIEFTATDPDPLNWVSVDFITSLVAGNDLITVSDETLDLSERTITSDDDPVLLARLNFIVPNDADPLSEYFVNLDLLFSDFTDVDRNNSATFSANTGTITISGAAVPEPSTTVALLLGTAVFAFRKRKTLADRMRRSADESLQK